jgi:hypothetical protein
MIRKVIEVTNGTNWGKFMVMKYDNEWFIKSSIPGTFNTPLLTQLGWTAEHIWVMDLQTGEGAFFLHGGIASHDLNHSHQIWVCPMYEPFLNWLYKQNVSNLSALPELVTLTEQEAPSSLYGYRRTRKEGT